VTADPEKLLKDLPEESPPPEVVLAAVRVFRLRALGALALSVALVLGVWLYAEKSGEASRFQERVGRLRYSVGTATVAEEHLVGDVHVLFWEVMADRDRAFIHVLAWGRADRGFSIEIRDVRVGGVAAPIVNLDGGGGCCPANDEEWAEATRPPSAGDGSRLLTFEVRVASDDGSVQGTTRFEREI
jgi:hypothetical protein